MIRFQSLVRLLLSKLLKLVNFKQTPFLPPFIFIQNDTSLCHDIKRSIFYETFFQRSNYKTFAFIITDKSLSSDTDTSGDFIIRD